MLEGGAAPGAPGLFEVEGRLHDVPDKGIIIQGYAGGQIGGLMIDLLVICGIICNRMVESGIYVIRLR